MEKNRKIIVSILVIIGLLCTSCQQGSREEEKPISYFLEPQYEWGEVSGKTLVVWGEDNNVGRTYVERVLERYQAMTNNKIEVVRMTSKEFEIYTALAFKEKSIDMPDIILSQGGVDLDDINMGGNLYDFSNEKWIHDLTISSLNQSIHNGMVVGLPYGEASISGILYNKDIFKQLGLAIPGSQQEFLELCETLKQNGITPVYLPYAEISMLLCQFPMDSFLQDQDALDKLNSGELTYLDFPEMKIIVSWYKTMSDKGYFGEDYLENNWDGMSPAMQSQKYAMMICWDTWLYTNFNGDPKQFGIMPAFIGVPDQGCFEGSNMQLFCVNRNSSNLDAALDFITFAADPYNYNAAFDGVNSAPIYKNMVGNISTPQYAESEKRINELFYPSTARLRLKGFSQLDASYIQRHMQESSYTVEECLRDMDRARVERMMQ